MFNRFFNSETKTITSAAGILAISTIISGILSLIGDWLLAKTFGASANLDIYFTAFKIPDLIYNILIAGGIIVTFLPLFSEYLSRNEKEAWQFCSNLLNLFLFSVILLSLILFIFTPHLVKLIAPGFGSEQLRKTIFLTRILFLSPILLGLSNIFSGILQYFNRFFVYGLSPIFYNLGIISGILFFAPRLGILGVVLGVILGCFLHLFIQIPSAKSCGFRYEKIFNFRDSRIKKVFLLMIPRAFGVSAQQINLIVITAIASTLATGSISIFNFANNIQNFPIGIIGVSFAIASFPVLSKAWAKNQKGEFIEKFSLTFRKVILFVIPASILMFVLRNQIVNIFLRHGQFSFESARLTSASLGLFSFGIFASALIPLIFRAFFSFQDTKTPTLVAIFCVILNIVLSFYFTNFLKLSNFFQNFLKVNFSLQGIKDISVIGLPLAFSITAIFQFIILMIFLKKRIENLNLKEIGVPSLKIILAGIFMIFSMRFILFLAPTFFNSQTFFGNFWQAGVSGLVGVLAYFLAIFFLKLERTF